MSEFNPSVPKSSLKKDYLWEVVARGIGQSDMTRPEMVVEGLGRLRKVPRLQNADQLRLLRHRLHPEVFERTVMLSKLSAAIGRAAAGGIMFRSSVTYRDALQQSEGNFAVSRMALRLRERSGAAQELAALNEVAEQERKKLVVVMQVPDAPKYPKETYAAYLHGFALQPPEDDDSFSSATLVLRGQQNTYGSLPLRTAQVDLWDVTADAAMLD